MMIHSLDVIVCDVTENLVWIQFQPGARVERIVMKRAEADRFRPFIGQTVAIRFEAPEEVAERVSA